MDVIVDANILVSDFRMRKNRFANLFDYLRRTDSALVICKVVWDEVLAEYDERLKGDIDRVTTAWEKLSQSRFTEGTSPDLPVRAKEMDTFQRTLKAPAKGVKVTIYSDYSRIDINEIVRRGVHRTRPANDAGEELRDVILWLHAIDYANRRRPRLPLSAMMKRLSKQKTVPSGKARTRKIEYWMRTRKIPRSNICFTPTFVKTL